MVEHEPHLVSMAIDAPDAPTEGGHKVVHRPKQSVCQDGPLEVALQPFDQIQVWAIRWQPEDFGDLPTRRQPRLKQERLKSRCFFVR